MITEKHSKRLSKAEQKRLMRKRRHQENTKGAKIELLDKMVTRLKANYKIMNPEVLKKGATDISELHKKIGIAQRIGAMYSKYILKSVPVLREKTVTVYDQSKKEMVKKKIPYRGMGTKRDFEAYKNEVAKLKIGLKVDMPKAA